MAEQSAGAGDVWQSFAALRAAKGHSEAVQSVSFSPDGMTLASGSIDRTIRLWRVADGQLLGTWSDPAAPVLRVAFSPDGALLASTSREVIHLRRASDGHVLNTLEGHTGSLTSLEFSRDGANLASASIDGTVKLWRISDRQLVHTWECHAHSLARTVSSLSWVGSASQQQLQPPAVESVAFSPDGQVLASGSLTGVVQIWSVPSRQSLHNLKGHTSRVLSVSFHRDGALLASGGGDRTVRIWEFAEGKLLSTLLGHTGAVTGVAFSPDGTVLVTSSDDRTIRLWRFQDGQPLGVLKGHTSSVLSVAVSPREPLLASGGSDWTVRFWAATAAAGVRTTW